MAIPRLLARWMMWLAVGGIVLLAFSGCTQRSEHNPFSPPYGSSFTQPFG